MNDGRKNKCIWIKQSRNIISTRTQHTEAILVREGVEEYFLDLLFGLLILMGWGEAGRKSVFHPVLQKLSITQSRIKWYRCCCVWTEVAAKGNIFFFHFFYLNRNLCRSLSSQKDIVHFWDLQDPVKMKHLLTVLCTKLTCLVKVGEGQKEICSSVKCISLIEKAFPLMKLVPNRTRCNLPAPKLEASPDLGVGRAWKRKLVLLKNWESVHEAWHVLPLGYKGTI